MKVYFLFPILYYFYVSELCIANGQGDTRRLRPMYPHGQSVMDKITNTEIFSASMAIMISREDRTNDVANLTKSATTCSSPSGKWLRRQVDNVSNADLTKFFDWHIHTLPFAYKLFVVRRTDESADMEYFGLDGEFTREISSVHERSRDFWSSHSGVDDDIRILGAHGSDLADREDKLIPTLEVLFGGSYTEDYTVSDHATDIQELISRLPGGYDHPLLTFNAFATDRVDDRRDGSPSIIIGDGYFEFQRSVGLGSEGPEYALTHEHAHHLQFSLLATANTEPEEGNRGSSDQTARRQELMADAFSAYFLAHDSGGKMTAQELSNIHEIAFSVGDCETNNDDRHHGTPQERGCATRWGASIANSRNAASIDLVELKHRFDMWYERIDGFEDLENFCQHHDAVADVISSAPVNSLVAHSMKIFVIIWMCR